jgi:hypothetical protein
MPFLSMVRFMVKWAVASIPALLILAILGALFWGVLLPKSGVKLTNFMQICPTNEHLPRRFMQQSVKAMRPTSASEELQAADSPANALGASQVPS